MVGLDGGYIHARNAKEKEKESVQIQVEVACQAQTIANEILISNIPQPIPIDMRLKEQVKRMF